MIRRMQEFFDLSKGNTKTEQTETGTEVEGNGV